MTYSGQRGGPAPEEPGQEREPAPQAGTPPGPAGDRRRPSSRLLGDMSGAFADLGTFLPLLVGMFAVQPLDPTGVLVGFGVFALATALIYRRPMPVQPMKAVAALVIAGSLDLSGIAASGLLLGAILCVLAAIGVVGRLGRLIPYTVMSGIQLGVGLYLVWVGIERVLREPGVGLIALAGLLLLQRTRFQPLAALAVITASLLWAVLWTGATLPELSPGLALPPLILPDADSLRVATQQVLLPQLALTLTNATLITAAIAADLFPQDRSRITPDRLAWSSGALNLLLAPFGAFPMCHGAGGLVVQYRFGARTGLAPAMFGLCCLALGLFLGSDAPALLALLPVAAIGALLIPAGIDLAVSKRLRRTPPDGLVVIVLTGLACAIVHVAFGLLLGLLLEGLRILFRRATEAR